MICVTASTLKFAAQFTRVLMSCSSVSIAAKDEPQPEKTKETYLVIYRPGPAWLKGKSIFEQPLKEHGKYLLSFYIKGSMRLAGPFIDNAGGAVLLTVPDESEAKAIVAEDPAVKSGIFVSEMHPLKLQPWDEFAKKAKDAAKLVAPTER
jgi:uncharacterized protein YciI